ncbi:MAG TPA: universal stress protein [Polyangiaceae bacterium]|nr:universal stress protein [Polyangiaceae bacterium]
MRILVGSDLGAASDEALRQAIELASAKQAELAVCYVLPEPQLHGLFPVEHAQDVETLSELEARMTEALRDQVESLSAGAAIPLTLFVEQGSAYSELVNRAEKWRADLVVVGNQGRGALKHLFFDSVAQRVARYAPCSALIARKDVEGVVLVATDLSDPAQLALNAGAREATRRKRGLVVVHVSDTLSRRTAPAMALLGANPTIEPPEVAQQRDSLARQIISTSLRNLGTEADIRLVSGDPSEEILRLVSSLPAELLVLGTRGRSNVTRIMLGGVATHMVEAASCSVLAVRAQVP